MVKIKDLSVGTRVLIVDEWVDPHLENDYGQMDAYLGTVMTVRELNHNYCCYMEEDVGDKNRETGWVWFPEMIARIYDEDEWDKEGSVRIEEDEFFTVLTGG